MQKHSRNFRSSFLLLSLLVVASAERASATLYDCDAGTFVVNSTTGNMTLSAADVIEMSTYSATPCVELRDGRDLNLNGAEIVCTNASGVCGVAVKGFAAGSLIEGGDITGSFDFGVQDVEEARNLRIDGSNVGIRTGGLGKRVSGNVITNAWHGIEWTETTTNLSYIRNNYIADGATDRNSSDTSTALEGCGTTTSPGIQVENNVIKDFADGILASGCSGTRYVRVTENILTNIDTDAIYTSGTSATVSGNICTDATDCPVATPFTMP